LYKYDTQRKKERPVSPAGNRQPIPRDLLPAVRYK